MSFKFGVVGATTAASEEEGPKDFVFVGKLFEVKYPKQRLQERVESTGEITVVVKSSPEAHVEGGGEGERDHEEDDEECGDSASSSVECACDERESMWV